MSKIIIYMYLDVQGLCSMDSSKVVQSSFAFLEPAPQALVTRHQQDPQVLEIQQAPPASAHPVPPSWSCLCDPQTLFLGRFCYIAFLEGCFSDFGLKITQRNRLLDFLGSCLFVVFINKSQSQNLWYNLYDHIWNPWCPLHWGWWVGEILHSSWGPKSPLVSLLMVFLVASQVQHCKFHRQLKVIIVGWNVFDSLAVDPRDVLRDRPRRLHCSTEPPQPQPPGAAQPQPPTSLRHTLFGGFPMETFHARHHHWLSM